jgi:integrase
MVELARYRLALGLAALPTEHERTPLVLPVSWHATRLPGAAPQLPGPLTRAALHVIVKGLFDLAAEQLEARGEAFQGGADRLRTASAHWLRHTAGSRMADGEVDLRHVRDTLGHASISTTSIYLHAEDDRRHQAIEAGHRLGWG